MVGGNRRPIVVAIRLIFLPIVALLTSSVLTICIIYLCKRNGWVVAPRPDRWHRKAVAQFGGVAVVGSFLLTAWFLEKSSQVLAVILLTGAIAAVGLCDDLWSWRPSSR